MKRSVLLILVLLLLMDLVEDGCLGKATVYLPSPSAKTSVTSHDCPGSGPSDFNHEFQPAKIPGNTCYVTAQPITFLVLHTLKIMHCCHFGGAGAIPL